MRRDTTPSLDESRQQDTVFSGRLLEVVVRNIELSDGSVSPREVVLHPGSAAILPVLPDGRILLVRQFRPAVDDSLWEIPAGKLEPAESPLEGARRELREETGYSAGQWEEVVAFYTTPGFCNERMTLFIARDLLRVGKANAREIAEHAEVTPETFLAMIHGRQIVDGKSILALYALLHDRSS